MKITARQKIKLSVHRQRWKDCSKCTDLEQPCGFIRTGLLKNKSTGLHTSHGFSILFLGEAPGESEQALGKPFVGRSGKLLDSVIGQANEHLLGGDYLFRTPERYDEGLIHPTFANVISCRPPGNRNPTKEEILNCRPKLLETIAIVNPMAVVCVGAIAKQAWTDLGKAADLLDKRIFSPREIQRVARGLTRPRINIKHPAAILRAPEQVQVFETAEAVCDLVCFVQDQLVKETTK